MKSICFLFGSGADSDYDSNLKSGASFVEALLCSKESDSVKCIVGDRIGHQPLIHAQSTRVFVQTIQQHEAKARKVLDETFVDNVLQYLQGEIKYKQAGIQNQCRCFYDAITKPSDDAQTNSIRKFFLDNAIFFDTLDEKFNSLRDCDSLNKHARQVVFAYWTVFLQMTRQAYHLGTHTLDIMSKEKAIKVVCEEQSAPTSADDSYYEVLKQSKLSCRVITTNYTDHIERMFRDSQPAYLHGKLHWFEDYRKLCVYDCRNSDERKQIENEECVVPFILIPSGVKPIICSKQLREFGKFIGYLDDSTILVVVGYKFNSEDNHINSIIGEWLKGANKRKLLYLNWCEDPSQKSVAFECMNWSRDFKKKVINLDEAEASEASSVFSSRCKIFDFLINAETCRKVFRNIVEGLKIYQIQN